MTKRNIEQEPEEEPEIVEVEWDEYKASIDLEIEALKGRSTSLEMRSDKVDTDNAAERIAELEARLFALESRLESKLAHF